MTLHRPVRTVRILALASVVLPCFLPFVFASGGGDGGHAAGPDAGEVLKSLKDGNHRFVEGKSTHPNSNAERRRELASGQKPGAIVLSCADSRVPPELLFDQGLGQLFTVRVAGNVLGAATVASIEYAVEHLGSRLIVVMGHESCGAVKAALATPPEKTAGSPDLDTLVSSIRPSLDKQDRSVASSDSKLRKPVISNVDFVASRLLQRSAIVRKHVEEGKVQIVRAIYGLESGEVEFWEKSKN